MKITVLYENTPGADSELAFGHGLSLFLEAENRTILFDFGRDESFMENAQKLGVDLGRAELAILSHGHNDHGGGLGAYLTKHSATPVHVRPTAFKPHGGLRDGNIVDITVKKPDIPVNTTESVHPIGDDLLLFSLPLEAPPAASLLEKDDNGTYTPDLFLHEQHLLLRENDRWHLVTGCAHAGIEKIVEQAEKLVNQPLSSIIGGLHYYNDSTPERLNAGAACFLKSGAAIITGHCTGEEACKYLFSAGISIEAMAVGKVFTV